MEAGPGPEALGHPLAPQIFEIIRIRLFNNLRLLASPAGEAQGLGERAFKDADTAELPCQFQMLLIHLVGEEEKDGGIHQRRVVGCEFLPAPSEMSPEAARAPLRILLEGEGVERLEEAAFGTEGTKLSATPEGEADALQERALSKRRGGLDASSCLKLGREAEADPGVDLEQIKARDVEAQSLKITLLDEGVREVGGDQLSWHVVLPPPPTLRFPCLGLATASRA
jgi:hypothetical protein